MRHRRSVDDIPNGISAGKTTRLRRLMTHLWFTKNRTTQHADHDPPWIGSNEMPFQLGSTHVVGPPTRLADGLELESAPVHGGVNLRPRGILMPQLGPPFP